MSTKPKIAVFSGPTATIQNSQPLVTSNKARQKYGLPLLKDPSGQPLKWDIVRPQQLATPVTVYIKAFSAHPLESDAVELYAPPDGYLDPMGAFHPEPRSSEDVPVYQVTLDPSDGLYMLPYMARQISGQAWEDDCTSPMALPEFCRQPFYPDPSRIFEEIDRFGMGDLGVNNLLSAKADFDFYRGVASGGYTKGLPEECRTDMGSGDIPPEKLGHDYFPYRPFHLLQDPAMTLLAQATNTVQRALASGQYTGLIWLEGSPTTEETTYWLSLLIDTTVPIIGNSSQRPHGAVGNDGDRNIIDSVNYLLSGIWADATGRDQIGGVMIQEEQIFTARDVQKGDARPGGYVATGGHGGIVGTIGDPGPPVLTFLPVKRHTYRSDVNLTHLPASVQGSCLVGGKVTLVPVQVKDAQGDLLPTAIPKVTISKYARYLSDSPTATSDSEADLLARIAKNLADAPLAGFILEGSAPYGTSNLTVEGALRRAVCSGMPVVRVGRGNAEGVTARMFTNDLFISGNNLTSTKARLLLMACLLRFGSLPPALDPTEPTSEEIQGIMTKVLEYQAVFNTH